MSLLHTLAAIRGHGGAVRTPGLDDATIERLGAQFPELAEAVTAAAERFAALSAEFPEVIALDEGGAHRPWPWADTHAVARIAAPRLGVSQVVLAGDSGRTLAFGPGWAESSAAPGTRGTTVLSGHRDTHFEWLRHLRDGDRVVLETAQGLRDYVVTATEVADSRRHRLATGPDQLVLVTCWPFDATAPRGPLRYLVTLQERGSGSLRHK